MKALLHTISVYLHLVQIRLKSQVVYHQSFCIEIIAHFLQMAVHVVSVFFIFYHVKAIAGWSFWEVLYLYGITSLAFVGAQFTFESIEDLNIYVRSGEFDQMLTKPISPIIQLAALSFRIDRFGGLMQAFAALIISGFKTGMLFSLIGCTWAGVSVISLYFIYCGLFLANGALSFWLLENSEFFNAFTYGGLEVAKYPLCIYPSWMQNLFLYVIPLGFVSYLPAVTLFEKSTQLANVTPSAFWAPLIALIFWWLVWLFWRFSLKHYQSTGS